MENELILATEMFRKKVKNFEDKYKKNHLENFEKRKMKKYVNKKMQKDIKFMLGINFLFPAIIIRNHQKI